MKSNKEIAKLDYGNTVIHINMQQQNSSIIKQQTIPLKTNWNQMSNNLSLVQSSDTTKVKVKPEYKKISYNNNSLINCFETTKWFNNTEDKYFYLFKKHKIKKNEALVFSSNNIKTSLNTIKEVKPQERNFVSNDWYIVPIIIGLITFAFVFKVYRKYFGKLFESGFYRYVSKKLVDDKNVSFKRFSFILDFLFIISFSLIIDQTLRRLNLYSPPVGLEFLLAILVALFLFSIRVLRFIVFRLFILFTNQKTFFNDLYINLLLYTRILGLILLPLVFLILYTSSQMSLIFICFSGFIIAITMIIRTIRSMRVFIDNGLSIFYFILYLCALEIAPFLVAWKELQIN